MRGGKNNRRALSAEGLRLEQRVQLSRGHWRREDLGGAVRSAGWWESVTVTWSPAAEPAHRPSLAQRALAGALDAITPALAEVAATATRRLLERRPVMRVIPPSRRQLPAPARALPRNQKNT
ncbi:MAG: hypothetical protein JOY82_13975 [Streptosporangiaceae bacterium]|nr:hypothetical protein [Streptosporangiaceae bacterium]MBV9855600.1 hypothetical protein [Streptosporangiaceae bacterium]